MKISRAAGGYTVPRGYDTRLHGWCQSCRRVTELFLSIDDADDAPRDPRSPMLVITALT